MKYQEEFFHRQIEDIHKATEDKEKLFEKCGVCCVVFCVVHCYVRLLYLSREDNKCIRDMGCASVPEIVELGRPRD